MSPLDTLGRAPLPGLAVRPRRSTCEDGGLARILGADASRPGILHGLELVPTPPVGISRQQGRRKRRRPMGRRGPVLPAEQRRGEALVWSTPQEAYGAVFTAGGTGGEGKKTLPSWSGGSKEWV